MATDIRRLLKVRFLPDATAEPNDGVHAIRVNNFMFLELGENAWLVSTPGRFYGGEREMSNDLNDNARHGKYEVMLATEEELRWASGEFLHN